MNHEFLIACLAKGTKTGTFDKYIFDELQFNKWNLINDLQDGFPFREFESLTHRQNLKTGISSLLVPVLLLEHFSRFQILADAHFHKLVER